MALRQLWGTTDEDVSGGYADSSTRMLLPKPRFGFDAEALLSGEATTIRAWTDGSGNQKAGIWNATLTSLLAERSTSFAVTAGWNNIPLDSNASIVSGTVYTAGAKGDTSAATGRRPKIEYDSYRFSGAYADAFVDDISSASSTNAYEPLVQIWGYVPPEITSFNSGSSVQDGDTGVPIVGTDFVDSSGDPAVHFCPTSTWDGGAAVAQTVTGTPTDTGITVTVVQGALSAGTVYAFVTTALGQRNATGFAVTLTAGSTDVVATFEAERGSRQWETVVNQTIVSGLDAERGSRLASFNTEQTAQSTAILERGSRSATFGTVQSVLSTPGMERGPRDWLSSIVQSAQSTLSAKRGSRSWLSSITIAAPGVVVATVSMDRSYRSMDANIDQNISSALEMERAAREASISAAQEIASTVEAERGGRLAGLDVDQSVEATIEAGRAAREWASDVLQSISATMEAVRAAREWNSTIYIAVSGDVVATIQMERGPREFTATINVLSDAPDGPIKSLFAGDGIKKLIATDGIKILYSE